MGSTLPTLEFEEFSRRLAQLEEGLVPHATGAHDAGAHEAAAHDTDENPVGKPGPAVALALYAHYRELVRWNPRLSLIGPGTADEVVERHYGEALACRKLLRPEDQRILDVGSGGGFPGLVLAAAEPGRRFYLAEARERKWAFLQTAIRAMTRPLPALSCQAVNARVSRPLDAALPRDVDLFTLRAVRWDTALLEALRALSPTARVLLWHSHQMSLPVGLSILGTVELPSAVGTVIEAAFSPI